MEYDQQQIFMDLIVKNIHCAREEERANTRQLSLDRKVWTATMK